MGLFISRAERRRFGIGVGRGREERTAAGIEVSDVEAENIARSAYQIFHRASHFKVLLPLFCLLKQIYKASAYIAREPWI